MADMIDGKYCDNSALMALIASGGYGGYGRRDDCRNDSCTEQLQLMQTLGDIKAAVPLAEAQVQLALAGVQNDITSNVTASHQATQATLTANMLANANSFSNVARDVANSVTIGERNTASIIQAVSLEGSRTRDLITSNTITELHRIAAERADEISDLRSARDRDRDRHGIEITMTNNQNQNQMQFQAQAQVMQTLSHGLVDALQNIRATNQAINIGSGKQIANPDNNNTNVRA